MNNLVCLVSAGMPFTVEMRIMIMLVLLLSLAAFVMSGFAAFLFYKFYRDTIKPVPALILEQTGNSLSLRLVNNGHSAFYIFRVFFTKNREVSSSLAEMLPFMQEEALFGMFTKSIEGRKVLPDQQMKIFELDFPFLGNYLTPEQLKSVTGTLDGMMAEFHCHDIGKRYKSVTSLLIEVK